MKTCPLTDCDCNRDGFCTDSFAHKAMGTCMSYNPVDKGDDDKNGQF